jgi:ssDNA-binding Zn-finger/Zn-ribbon topoisomerase 1
VTAAPTIPCPACGGSLSLKSSRYGPFYGCSNWPACDQTHGAHPDGKPLGIPADKATREARIRAHAALDTLWQSGRMKRKAAYRWMQEAMGLGPKEAHIGGFNIEQCERLVSLIESKP